MFTRNNLTITLWLFVQPSPNSHIIPCWVLQLALSISRDGCMVLFQLYKYLCILTLSVSLLFLLNLVVVVHITCAWKNQYFIHWHESYSDYIILHTQQLPIELPAVTQLLIIQRLSYVLMVRQLKSLFDYNIKQSWWLWSLN